MCVCVCAHTTAVYSPLCCAAGARESAINRAEGLRQSKILTSEAEKIQQINRAQGEVLHYLGDVGVGWEGGVGGG